MSGVLHPVGPEEPKTYWVRRVGVIAAVLIVLALIIVLAVKASGGERQATPQASPSKGAPQATTSPPDATTPTSTSASATSSATTTSPSPSATKSSASPSPTPTKAETPDCEPKDVRTTLTGQRKFKAKEHLTFNLSVINGGARSCVVDVNSKTFELKIYSGADRIWSTNDCAATVKPIKKTIGAEKSVEWKIAWDGKRSVKDCKSRPEVPKPGTYIATAHLDGAKAVKLGMTLTS